MKKLTSLLLCLLLVISLSGTVFATVAVDAPVTDGADLLTPEEEAELCDTAQRIYREYGIWMAIVTTDSLGGKTAERYADDFYDDRYYPQYPDGILLLISMEKREWAISTCGDGILLMSDGELDRLFSEMSDELAENRFYEAFVVYFDALPRYLNGGVESETDFGDYIRILLVSLGVGAAVGGITLLGMRSQMNTAKAQTGAGNYLVNGSYQLKVHHDIFLYSRVTRTRKPQNNGGGSSHRSSGGVRHGGRSGRF